MTASPGDGRDDSADDLVATDRAGLDRARADTTWMRAPGPAGSTRWFPPVDSPDAPQAAGVAVALAAAIAIQRRNEANRPRLQQWVGATPRRQAREELTVRAGALAAGTLAHLLVAGAMTGVRRYQDRRARLADARIICQIVGVAAQAPDGSIPADGRVVLESAMKGTGLDNRARKRLLAEPRPAGITDLEPCPLQEPLLTAVPSIAFSAMAEATSPEEAARRIPSLLRRIGLPRPTAEAMAGRLLEEYTSTQMILSDYYAQLPSPEAERPVVQLHLPVREMIATAGSVIARNPNELARQVTRQAFATLIRRGIRATLGSGIRLSPATFTAVRVAAQLLGEHVPAIPEQITSAPRKRGDAKRAALSPRPAKSPKTPK